MSFEGVTHLLDTSVLSQPVKDTPVVSVIENWESLGEARLATSAICLAELLRGLKARNSKKYWARYRELLEPFEQVISFDAETAEVYAGLDVALKKQGRTKPGFDLLIASTAVAHGLRLATLNVRDFSGIPGLVVEDWGQELTKA